MASLEASSIRQQIVVVMMEQNTSGTCQVNGWWDGFVDVERTVVETTTR